MKKLLTALVVATTIVATPVYSEQQKFNSSQYDNMNYAYHFGEQFTKKGDRKTHNEYNKAGMGYIFAGLAWQESNGGQNTKGSPEHNAYGIFQNYLPTVKARAKQQNLHMSNSQIKRMLSKRENSASWAYVELSYWIKKYNGNMRKALASYNAGNNYRKGMKYSEQVIAKANYLKEQNLFKAVD